MSILNSLTSYLEKPLTLPPISPQEINFKSWWREGVSPAGFSRYPLINKIALDGNPVKVNGPWCRLQTQLWNIIISNINVVVKRCSYPKILIKGFEIFKSLH